MLACSREEDAYDDDEGFTTGLELPAYNGTMLVCAGVTCLLLRLTARVVTRSGDAPPTWLEERYMLDADDRVSVTSHALVG